jgi:hypothetical protein
MNLQNSNIPQRFSIHLKLQHVYIMNVLHASRFEVRLLIPCKLSYYSENMKIRDGDVIVTVIVVILHRIIIIYFK